MMRFIAAFYPRCDLLEHEGMKGIFYHNMMGKERGDWAVYLRVSIWGGVTTSTQRLTWRSTESNITADASLWLFVANNNG